MRKNYYQTLLTKKLTFFAEQNSGNLSHQLGNDMWQIAHTMTSEISSALRGVAFFTGGIGFLLYTSVPLTIVSILPISSLAVISRYYGGSLKRERQKMAELSRNNNAYIQEKLSHIKTVKLFTAERLETQKYSESLSELYNKAIDVSKLSAKHHGIMEGLGQNAILWCIGYGAYLISVNSGLDLGKLTAFAMYSMYCGLGFRLLSSGYTELKKVSGIYKQIHENAVNPATEEVLFSHSQEPQLAQSFKKSEKILTSIELKNVFFKYPTRDSIVLDGLSLQIHEGEIIGLIGHSGSGKSSIFHLLTNLYQPISGGVFINGVNVNEKPAWWSRQMISIVAQESLLFTGTISDNIKYSDPTVTQAQLVEACKRADAYEFIMDLPENFETQVGEQGYALSGGQRQRILIARALLKKPHIFLFDEATSALDANSEGYFQKVIENELRGKGYTVLIISHRVKSLKGIVDKYVVLQDGRVVACDTYENLKQKPEFKLLL